MKKLLLDTNIYGEMVVDPKIEQVKNNFENCEKQILIYGIKSIIRKELRQTPKDSLVEGKKLRSNMLGLYDSFTMNHELSVKEEHKKLADVNDINNKITPKFIGYNEFKSELRSRLSNKLIGNSNKIWIFLVFLNFFYQFVKVNFFAFHTLLKSIASIKNYRIYA